MDEVCGASAEVMGRHEEKLSNLEGGQTLLTNNLQEVKSDLKELIEFLKSHLEQSQAKLEERQHKLEGDLTDFKKLLFSLFIKAVIGGMSIAIMALAWYVNKISIHVIG